MGVYSVPKARRGDVTVQTIQELSRGIAARLVSSHHWEDASLINLPLAYPSGAFVSVRLSPVRNGIRVSDAGFAYREVESFGLERSFSRTASSIAENFDVEIGKRSIFIDVPTEQVERAIFDVSAASRAVAERIISNADEVDVSNLAETLLIRLEHLFPKTLEIEPKVIGKSSTEWKMTAVTHSGGHTTVFQAVTNYAASIYRTSTAFVDLAGREDAPSLVAVVPSKEEIGAKVAILAQVGRVIEIEDGDATYMRAAA